LDDLIIGAQYAAPSGKSNAGKSYVVFGKTDSTAINLSTIASGTGGFPSPLTSPAVETDWPLQSLPLPISPLMTKPPVPLAMADK
jgi:hypothetical protein